MKIVRLFFRLALLSFVKRPRLFVKECFCGARSDNRPLPVFIPSGVDP